MHIISRQVSQGIVLDEQTTVTVVAVNCDEVTLEVTGPDGDVERVTLKTSPSEPEEERVDERELVSC